MGRPFCDSDGGRNGKAADNEAGSRLKNSRQSSLTDLAITPGYVDIIDLASGFPFFDFNSNRNIFS
jgi:hypothetical protein